MKETVLIDTDRLEKNIGQLDGVPVNPRCIVKERMEALKRSVEGLPDMMELRELLVYPYGSDYVVLGGNMRLEACQSLGWKKIPCKVIDKDTPAHILRRIAMLDNEAFGATDWSVALESWDVGELAGWGIEVPAGWAAKASFGSGSTATGNGDNGEEQEETEQEREEDDEDGEVQDASEEGEVLDVLFPSDNEYEVPVLLKERMAGRLELPVTPWGANSRLRKDVDTYHFYVDDYRFSKLFKDPFNLIMSGCKQIVEPNCSLHDQTPIAWGIAEIYKKRWLARYCQERGIGVYVDLNVSGKFAEYNLLGVPDGWDAFMTRGIVSMIPRLQSDLDIARRVSGKQTPNLIVYGGGREARQFCQENGLLYVQDFINEKDI